MPDDDREGVRSQGGPLAERRQLFVLVLCFVSILLVFLVDIITPQGIAFEVLYVAPVFIILWFFDRRAIYVVSFACTILSVIGYFLSPSGAEYIGAINRLLSILLVWLVAVLGVVRKGFEFELEKVTKELRESNRTLARSEAMVSQEKERAEMYIDLLTHDINNLNASAIGYLQLAQDKLHLDDKDKRYTSKPLEAITASSELIGTVRKIQQVESHQDRKEEFDLDRMLVEIANGYVVPAGREVSIHYRSQGESPILSSPLLKDVFLNIIGNSIKHSTGPVRIGIEMDIVRDNGSEFYYLTIADNGPGVPDDLKEKVFSRFQRGGTRASGQGLGLYLVKRIVEGSGGTVAMEDRIPGDHAKGARVVVKLPAPARAETAPIDGGES